MGKLNKNLPPNTSFQDGIKSKRSIINKKISSVINRLKYNKNSFSMMRSNSQLKTDAVSLIAHFENDSSKNKINNVKRRHRVTKGMRRKKQQLKAVQENIRHVFHINRDIGLSDPKITAFHKVDSKFENKSDTVKLASVAAVGNKTQLNSKRKIIACSSSFANKKKMKSSKKETKCMEQNFNVRGSELKSERNQNFNISALEKKIGDEFGGVKSNLGSLSLMSTARKGLQVSKLKEVLKKAKELTTSSEVPFSILRDTPSKIKFKNTKNLSLKERMINKLNAARFRWINEQMYLSDSHDAQAFFKEDPESFTAYHKGFKQQVAQWPINPLDIIINSLQKKASERPDMVIADFGCGEAQLARSVEGATVHSLDLVALCPRVTACDMAHSPLASGSVDIAVFCLALMGTNLADYIREANRVLKKGGQLKIAEVESRFDSVATFVEGVERFGFQNVRQDLTHNLFYFLDFKKKSGISKKRKNKFPDLSLKPCLYKKR